MLGLVLRHPRIHPFSNLAAAGTGMRLRCALPNQFRCQTSKPSRFIGKARPWAVKTCRMFPACSLIGVAYSAGGDQEAVNESGGADRDRTDDPLLAKQVLSQLSYSPTCGCLRQSWWAWVESNYRPHPYQGCALTN